MGRSFTFDATVGNSYKFMEWTDPKARKRATAAADSPFRYLEEFINRYVVTASSDAGDVDFDSAGTYTFNGNVAVKGTADITSIVTLGLMGAGVSQQILFDPDYNNPYTSFNHPEFKLGDGQIAYVDYTIDASSNVRVLWLSSKYNSNGGNALVQLNQPTWGGGEDVLVQMYADPGSSANASGTIYMDATGTGTGLGAVQAIATDNIWLQSTDIHFYNTAGTTRYGLFNSTGLTIGSGDDGLGTVSGSYGSVQTFGSGKGGYEGYSIHGRLAFMENGSGQGGIFDDLNNRWKVRTDLSATGGVSLYAGTVVRLTSTAYGITVVGSSRNNDGAAAAPAFSFTSDTNSGLYRTASFVGLAFNGSTGIAVRATDVIPGSDNTKGLGDASFRWVDVWAVDTTINSSDMRAKNRTGPPLGSSFLRRLTPFSGEWIDRPGPIHQWLSGQDVQSALVMEGRNTKLEHLWHENEDTGFQSLSYPEFVPPLIASQNELWDLVEELAREVADLKAAM